MIVGNHDVAYKNTNDTNSPDLLLNDYSNISVYKDPQEIYIGELKVLLMPWICSDNYEQCMKAIEESNATVMLGHLEISGFQMYKGHNNDEGFDRRLFSKFNLVCSGHFHHRSNSDNIVYLGNPYEITWSDYDDPRGFHIFDSETLELEFVPNPFNIFTKIYYDDSKPLPVVDCNNKYIKLIVVSKTDFNKFDNFVEKIERSNPLELKIIEDMSEFESEALVDENVNLEDTMTLLQHYVDGLDTDADKDRIKTLMKTLYIEAQEFN